MRNTHAWLLASSSILVAAALPLACSAAKHGGTAAGDTGGAGNGGTAATGGSQGQGGGITFDDGGMDPVVTLSIAPQTCPLPCTALSGLCGSAPLASSFNFMLKHMKHDNISVQIHIAYLAKRHTLKIKIKTSYLLKHLTLMKIN